MSPADTLLARSLAAVWHPCTQMKQHETLPLVPIEWSDADEAALQQSLADLLGERAQSLVIDVEPAGVRRLGLFELPQLDVRYRFGPGDEAARRALLVRLDRAMQKGGG